MTGDRILIVEDDPYIAEAVGVHLELSGYEHTTLDDGRAAAEHLRDDHAYDLALLDVMLPGLDGFQLMEPLRAYGIPVLYLSAKADVPSRVHGLRLGAEDYLVKPFEMIELLVRMEKILGRTGRRGRTLRYRDIEIDTETASSQRAARPSRCSRWSSTCSPCSCGSKTARSRASGCSTRSGAWTIWARARWIRTSPCCAKSSIWAAASSP